MSRVSLKFFAGAAEAFGTAETEVEGPGDLTELVEALTVGRDARLKEVLDQCSFFVDGEHCRALDTPLPAEARVDVLPPFAGG